MMDSMQDAGKYDWAFGLGFMYSYVLTVPHSVAINLAYPTEIATQGEFPSSWGCSKSACDIAKPLFAVLHSMAIKLAYPIQIAKPCDCAML